jgi:hypothetical protein
MRLDRLANAPLSENRPKPETAKLLAARMAAMSCLALSGLSGTAFAEDELFPTPPPLADSGWTVPYNELLLACYQGTMEACDRVASDRGMVFDTPIYNYAATCGGRLDVVTARRLSAQMLENGIPGGTCSHFLKPSE